MRGLIARLGRHLPRRTLRLRLAVLYGSVFLVSGTVLLGLTYGLVAGRQGFIGSSSAAVSSAVRSGLLGSPNDPRAARTLVSVATSQHSEDLRTLLVMSALALAVVAVGSMVLGWWLAGRVLRPLRTITTIAREISASNLDQRLALAGSDDELKELADTFDGLLGRLDVSFQSQRRFVANASHELRTPLARLKTIAQVALADPNATEASLRAAHERVLASEDQLERLLDALLTLASGEQALERREPLDLAALTARALRSQAGEIEHRGLRLDAALEQAGASGNAQLVEQLIANLLDNAIRHNNPNGSIDVLTGTEEGSAVLAVANSGAVIAPVELERLALPFQRLGPERTNHRDGHGLGFSIIHAIASAHGATVAVRAQPGGGLAVAVRFPRDRAASATP
jgi:signal transduction histidine kinase